YLSHFQNIGRGPSEYKALTDMFVDSTSKLIHLLCDFPFKIMTIDYQMNFIRAINVEKFYLQFVADNKYFYCRRAETTNNIVNDFYLDVIDRESAKVVKSMFPITLSFKDLQKPR